MDTPVEDIYYLEELAANAWTAEVVQLVDGWRFRYTLGVPSRRVNSVWPNNAGRFLTVERKIELAESFYARRSVPTRFQICPAAQPLELDVVLAERGYLVDAPTYVQTASIIEVLAHLKANEEDTVVFLHTRLPAEFADFQQHQYLLSREQAAARHAAFNRIGPEQVYALAMVAGETAGIGMGTLERGWLGIFGMMTHPDMRRRGVATAVLQALVRWGQKQGAMRTYLQVMENNDKALALYQEAGFITRYQYHYRQSP